MPNERTTWRDSLPTIEETKAFYRSPYGIALLVYFTTMAIIGLSVPADILKSNAWAREFSDFMASLIPQIDRVTSFNIRPDVNRFFLSVQWAASPIFGLINVIHMLNARKKPNYEQKSMFQVPVWRAWFTMPLTILFLFAYPIFWQGMPSTRQGLAWYKGFGMVTIGQCQVLAPWLFVLLPFWLEIYIPRLKKSIQSIKDGTNYD